MTHLNQPNQNSNSTPHQHSSPSVGEWSFEVLSELQLSSEYYPETTSTNLLAKDKAMDENNPLTFYLTDHQTAGRGQGTHLWQNSAPGTNLLITCSLKSKNPPQPELCMSLGNLLKDQCESSWPQLNWKLKAPNDLFLSEKKVAGILLESVSQGSHHRLLFGLGFNVFDNPTGFDFESTNLQAHLNEPLPQQKWKSFFKNFIQALLNSHS